MYLFNSLTTQHAHQGYMYSYSPCNGSFSLGQPHGCIGDVAVSCMYYFLKLGDMGNHFNSNNRPRSTCPVRAKSENSSNDVSLV